MTRQIMVGSIPMGGGAPVVIQSMLNTKTTDISGSLAQIKKLQIEGPVAANFSERYIVWELT